MRFKGRLKNLFDNWVAKVLALTAAIILYAFNHSETLSQKESIMVPLTVILPEGFAISSPLRDKVNCTFKGNMPDNIFTLDFIDQYIKPYFKIYIDLSFVGEPGYYDVNVIHERTGFVEGYDFYIEQVVPSEITDIHVDRVDQKKVPITVSFEGVPLRGYDLVNYTVHPDEITIKGPKERLETLNSVSTETIDINDRATDFIVEVKIVYQKEFFTITETEVAEVHCFVKEKILERTFNDIPIVVINLLSGMIIENVLPLGQMTLKGPELLLEDFNELDLKLILNLDTIYMPGKYNIHLYYNIPPGAKLLDYSPKDIEITLNYSIQEIE